MFTYIAFLLNLFTKQLGETEVTIKTFNKRKNILKIKNWYNEK